MKSSAWACPLSVGEKVQMLGSQADRYREVLWVGEDGEGVASLRAGQHWAHTVPGLHCRPGSRPRCDPKGVASGLSFNEWGNQ